MLIFRLFALHWQVRRALKRDGFAAAMRRYSMPLLDRAALLSATEAMQIAERAARHLRRFTRFRSEKACLDRSLALCAWLHQNGILSELKIGGYKQDGLLRAHAWVELAGIPILEASNVQQIYLEILTGSESLT
jgi:hypothetical protein